MENETKRPQKAYANARFLNSGDARPLRILAEYLEPASRFERLSVADTVVFMGSARTSSPEQARGELESAPSGSPERERAEQRLAMSRYYEAARQLAFQLTEWSKQLPQDARRFVVCTGGGPGIMEAASRGASEARGLNVGLTISIPVEEYVNRFITRELALEFHYFFMRKFWFVYLAKAVIIFPGGFGTLDELFEILTLLQTHKLRKRLPVVLFGTEYWTEVINFDALVKYGTIDEHDLSFILRTDSVDEAFQYVTTELARYSMEKPGATL